MPLYVNSIHSPKNNFNVQRTYGIHINDSYNFSLHYDYCIFQYINAARTFIVHEIHTNWSYRTSVVVKVVRIWQETLTSLPLFIN